MRGTHGQHFNQFHILGIIPAYAGNTLPTKPTECPKRDHPRVCGEHPYADTYWRLRAGSSPRMRGTHSIDRPRQGRSGIIPAYAGNTWWHGAESGNEGGSSPRMRGTHADRLEACSILGIIPAYAGNTSDRRGHCHHTGDHPRVCGEHIIQGFIDALELGSSPRMRGTLSVRTRILSAIGIIPAYAGNTQGRPVIDGHKGDHPRVCGEHPTCFSKSSNVLGSSPRMRGTLTMPS